jgi:general secretion pathway protein G
MLVVIAIIGMIMGLVAPRVLSYLSTSKEKAARIQISSLAPALDLYFLDMGRYPATNEGLQALIERPPSASSWGGPYLRDAILPADPWGRNYIYRSPGGRSTPYDIVSLGPSGQEGGSDNISSSQR